MAQEFSFDIVSEFDLQELRNVIDQARREVSTRFDFKGITAEISLHDDDITVISESDQKLQAIKDIIYSKLPKRGLSTMILDPQTPEQAASSQRKQIFKLIKALDQDNCKKISKKIRDAFPKARPSIQGSSIRVSSKSKDELQSIMTQLKGDQEIKLALQFKNMH